MNRSAVRARRLTTTVVLAALLLSGQASTAAADEPSVVDEAVVEAAADESVASVPYVFNQDGSLDVAGSVAAYATALEELRTDALGQGMSTATWAQVRDDGIQQLQTSLSNPAVAAVIESEGTVTESDSDSDLLRRFCNYSSIRTYARTRYFIFPTYNNFEVDGPFSCVGDVALSCAFFGAIAFGVPPGLIPIPGSGLLDYNYYCFAAAISPAGVRPTAGYQLAQVTGSRSIYVFPARAFRIT